MKQNNSWEIEWKKLTVKSYNLKTEKYEDEPIIFVNDKSWEKVKNFITKTLQQQREEDIKNICKGVDKIINDNVVPEIGSINYPRIILMLDKYLQSLKQENK